MFGALSRLGVAVKKALSSWAVGSSEPALAFGFTDNLYRTNNSSASLSQAFTHSRSGNATMTDSDGNIKWAPHNLLTYSEDFSNAAWTKTDTTVTANQAISPDGTLTADLLQITGSAGANQALFSFLTLAATVTYSIWVKAVESGDVGKTIRIDSTGGGGAAATVTLTADWQKVSISPSPTGYAQYRLISTTGMTATKLYIWGAHLYRSDLGGMVNNPERGDSYVPTAARPFGPELVTNGTFDTDTSGWAINVASRGSVGWDSSGRIKVTNDGADSYPAAEQFIFVEAGKAYELTVDVDIGTATLVDIRIQSADFSVQVTESGRYSVTYISSTSILRPVLLYVFEVGNTGNYAYFDNVSVKESSVNPAAARYMPRVGHHVYNGTSWANEGYLHESESRTNLVTYSNDFTDASWVENGASVVASTTTAPDGFTTPYEIVENSGAATQHRIVNTLSISSGVTYTASVYVKRGTGSRQFGILNVLGGSRVYFNLDTGTVATETLGSGKIEDVGGGWYRCSSTGVSTSTSTAFYLALCDGTVQGSETYDGDGLSSLVIYGAQLEAGTTPSSYIPTSGATVTRAADSAVIPSANLPWPTPEVIGAELVTNGTFDTDTSGWTGYNYQGHSVTLTSVSGQLNIQNDPVNGGNAAAYQNLTTVAGKVYRITFDWKSGSGDVRARDGSISGTSLAQAISSGAGSYSLSFVATSTTTVIAVSNNAVTVGLTSVIDNISVREIKPLSVSIQMDGRMTYADEGSNAQDMFVYWVKDASNYIQIYTDTRAADTGQIRFNQTAAGVADVIDSSGTAYSPGILVPYNIASRHGSTFINGAVDGTALTADLTPVALPDLSSTNLSLGYDYMGTINQFRVWSQDLGDTGIVEATEPSLEPSLSLTFDGSGSSFIVEDWV